MSAIEYRTEAHTAVITINRPEARNAVNDEVALGIEEAIDRIEANQAIWVGILTGVPPVFCAGADLKMVGSGRSRDLFTARGGFAGITRRDRTKPIIAAVDGPSLAGGTEIVLACDLVVASTLASFGIPEVKRGLVAGSGGIFRLPRKIPFNIAMECALTGDSIDAETAARYGLVNRLCQPGETLERARELAERINANAPIAVRVSRQILLESASPNDQNDWRLSEQGAAKVMASKDTGEGMAAFIEKRPPVWSGE